MVIFSECRNAIVRIRNTFCKECGAFSTRLKNKIKWNSSWEDAFYPSEWVKIHSCWVILVFHFMYVAANASELFCMAHLVNNSNLLF